MEELPDAYGAWRNWVSRDSTISELASILRGKSISPTSVKMKQFRRFKNEFSYAEVVTDRGVLWFPTERASSIRNKFPKRKFFWNDCGWFHPAYLSNGFVSGLRPDLLESQLSGAYSFPHMATMWEQGFSNLQTFEPYLQTIFESFEAFALGLHTVAVSSIVPIVEGTLRGLKLRLGYSAESTKDMVSHFTTAVAKAVAGWCYSGCSWIPNEFKESGYLSHVDEFVWMVEGYQTFLETDVFSDTRSQQVVETLNRNGILHGLFGGFGTRLNFYLYLSMLEMHSLIANMVGENALLFPESNQRSESISRYLGALALFGRGRRTISELVRLSE